MTLLSDTTAPYVEALLTVHILKGLRPGELSRTPPAPPSAGARHVLFEQYWVEAGPGQLPEADARDDFVVTPSMRRHLATLARAVLLRRHPILLQVRGLGSDARAPQATAQPARKRTITFVTDHGGTHLSTPRRVPCADVQHDITHRI